ncbi:MAG: isoprenylcysteine carboxylmethyltransferase family protein, partial [Proteobacteria bacterium]|nr:isoprenylcysteine carboxylmethyltransferase family protein [Pseudomonadota bacterium]
SRNPMYLALSLLYAGIGIAADGPWTLALLVPLLLVMHYGVIIREERYLERKFGDDYRRYKSTTRRWL